MFELQIETGIIAEDPETAEILKYNYDGKVVKIWSNLETYYYELNLRNREFLTALFTGKDTILQ